MTARIYKSIDKVTGEVKLPVTVSDAVYLEDEVITNRLKSISADYVYVDAALGDDSNDGSENYPVKTLEGAISIANMQYSDTVVVNLKQDTYSLVSTLNINSTKKIIIYGNKSQINPFSDVEFSLVDGLYKSTVGGYSPTWIFVNGIKRYLASTKRPNILLQNCGMTDNTAGLVRWGTVTAYYLDNSGNKVVINSNYAYDTACYGKELYFAITLPAEDIATLAVNDLYKRVRFHFYQYWTSKFSNIYALDTVNNQIIIRNFNNNNDTPTCAGGGLYFLLENIPVDLTWNASDAGTVKNCYKEGTFYYDKDGYIYYKPVTGETVESIQVSSLDNIANINSPTIFENIVFRGSKYNWFNEYGVCPDRQGAYQITPSIRVYGDNVKFNNCEFYDFENTCVGFYNGAKYGCVDKCNFHHIGSSSVRFGEDNNGTIPATNIVEGCTMKNCTVFHYGEVFEQSCGIIVFFCKNCNITHNTVALGFYTGITAGYCWDDPNNSYHFGYDDPNHPHQIFGGNIDYNNVMCISNGLMRDLGGIYVMGNSNGMKVTGNRIQYVYSVDSDTFGIYSDASSMNYTIQDNLIFKTATAFRNNNHSTYVKWFRNACGSVDFSITNHSNNISCEYAGNIFVCANTNIPAKYTNDTWTNNIFYCAAGTAIDVSSLGSTNKNLNPYFKNTAIGDFSINDRTNVNQIGWIDKTYTSGVLSEKMQNVVNSYATELATFKALH